MRRLHDSTAAAVLSAVLLAWPMSSNAALSLTPSGVAQGFTLTRFAEGIPVSHPTSPIQNGPQGIAFLPNNGVIFMDYHVGSFGAGTSTVTSSWAATACTSWGSRADRTRASRT